MSLVKGESVVVAEYDALLDIWILWGCAKSAEFSTATELIETSVSGSGNSATFLPAKRSASGSMEGLTNLNGVGIISLPDLRARQLDGDLIHLRIQRTNVDASGIYSDTFDCYIDNVTDTGALDGMNTFSVTFKVSGPVAQSFTPTEFTAVTPTEIYSNLQRFEYTGLAGETSFSDVVDTSGNPIDLTGRVVLGLEVDGIGYSKMITTGTPVAKQFKFISATGILTVPVPMDAGIEAFGYYR